MSTLFDDRVCLLGEGPLWHPERKQLFWFDILNRRLLTRQGDAPAEWQFDEIVSAAGWIDRDRLLIASETRLFEFNLATGGSRDVCTLEADNPTTRSNDGRADPKGGFWIGTMGKQSEPDAGSIYRYYRGELRQLFPAITISNAICFAPDGTTAFFSDTRTRTIQKVSLDGDGWPIGAPATFIDMNADELNPDGAVVDLDGCLWNAQWGANRVARYSPEGAFLDAIAFPAVQVSCPAFGGPGYRTLFATSAAINQTGEADGKTYVCETEAKGQAEHRVLL